MAVRECVGIAPQQTHYHHAQHCYANRLVRVDNHANAFFRLVIDKLYQHQVCADQQRNAPVQCDRSAGVAGRQAHDSMGSAPHGPKLAGLRAALSQHHVLTERKLVAGVRPACWRLHPPACRLRVCLAPCRFAGVFQASLTRVNSQHTGQALTAVA